MVTLRCVSVGDEEHVDDDDTEDLPEDADEENLGDQDHPDESNEE